MLLGIRVFVVVALWCWCVLRSACAFPVDFGPAWGVVWPRLARASVCSLVRSSGPRSSLDDLPSKHDEYVFSPNGPERSLVGVLFQFFYGFTEVPQLIGHCHMYIYIYIF